MSPSIPAQLIALAAGYGIGSFIYDMVKWLL